MTKYDVTLLFIIIYISLATKAEGKESSFCAKSDIYHRGGDVATTFIDNTDNPSTDCIKFCLQHYQDANFWQFLHEYDGMTNKCYCKREEEIEDEIKITSQSELVDAGELKPNTENSSISGCQMLTIEIDDEFYRGTGGCRLGFVKISNACYYISEDARTYASATERCVALGAQLLYMDSRTENNAIRNYLIHLKLKTGKSPGYWTSLYRSHNQWRWHGNVAGTVTSYTDWASGEPSIDGEPDGDGNCMILYPNEDFQWAEAVSCSDISPYICKI